MKVASGTEDSGATYCAGCGILLTDCEGRWLDGFTLGDGNGQLCPKCHYQKLVDRDDRQAKNFVFTTCSHCGEECYVKSLESCKTCGKPGCQRCLASQTNTPGPGMVLRWHVNCPHPWKK